MESVIQTHQLSASTEELDSNIDFFVLFTLNNMSKENL